MSISKNYNHKESEKKWYDYWQKKGYFKSTPDDREPFTIVIPPPNVTGVLHMGHMLNNTIQDILIRKSRMEGFNACWVPGTDHASIATEAKVVQKLIEKGINKSDLSRDEFLKHAYEWKDTHGGIILKQLKKIGASCDWDRTKFTMDTDMNKSVIHVFVDLYNKGYIYRGIRMINWDTSAQTAVSDEEVIYKQIKSKLYYITYNILNSKEKITIATTRPETILGDTAICVNPNDKRYSHLTGKKAIIPLINRNIPIIFDEYVDMDFGTGALKITPSHDINDYEIGNKHNLEKIEIFNDDGTLNINAQLYVGQDRFDVREKISLELDNKGYLLKKEDYINNIGFSERTNTIIEPKISTQWFCKMKKLSKPALENVLNGEIKFYPSKFINTYKYWIENIKDWCISRQLWWGQQIPAYYYEGNKFVVAETKEEALKLAIKENPKITLNDLRQDEDVLDTWFSSWLWPISVFDGIKNPENADMKYYYPTNDLVTAPEILFFWVARMIISGSEYTGKIPFKNVYLTGIVRDSKGRKMSKSLGNSPDPIQLIEKYSADGVRVGMLLCSPAGNDLPFDESLCQQGRNFANKLWNAYRLINGWEFGDIDQPESSKKAIIWIENKIIKSINEINDSFDKYRISEALMSIYKLIWDDFCSWYLEIIKPEFGKPIDVITYNSTILQLEKILKLLHPFMPYISEEIWHLLENKDTDIIISKWPKNEKWDENLISKFDITSEVISSIRNFRKEKNIPKKDKISLYIKSNKELSSEMDSIIYKLGNIDKITYTKNIPTNVFSFMIGSNEYFIPITDELNIKDETEKLQNELKYTIGFLEIVKNKLSNINFVEKAPQHLVENERNKLKDAENKIKILSKKINEISND
tara:strand:+ start:11712 stop:14327 length:2616 start_codon:yes stop_codon:yes gene_type:complete